MVKSRLQILKQYLFLALLVILLRTVFRLLFGEASWPSFWHAVSEGAKLAAWVLGFGLINAFVDFRKLLPRSPRFFRTPVTALNISMALTPEVGRSLERVKNAGRLRAHRKGVNLVRSVVVPVLSNAIDKAINLGDSMVSRGFGSNQSMPPLDRIFPLETFSKSFGEKRILEQVSLVPAEGKLTLISGNTGSGKTTLLRALLAINPGASFVCQFPRDGFVADTVVDELSFALVQQRLSKSEISERVSAAAKQFGLEKYLKTEPQLLSSGFQQRLAIAASLISGSRLLILDEPFSALDRKASAQLQKLLATLLENQITIVIAEHRTDLLEKIAHESLTLNEARLTNTPRFRQTKPTQRTPTGNVTVLFGENGSGKTTHLLKKAGDGGVLIPQPASDLLFLNSVAEELSQADSDCKAPSGTTQKTFNRLVGPVDLEQNPRDLSEGQKLALVIAIQLSQKTELLLLDEPTLGLDTPSRKELRAIIQQIAADGTEIWVATHDENFAKSVAVHKKVIANEVVSDVG